MSPQVSASFFSLSLVAFLYGVQTYWCFSEENMNSPSIWHVMIMTNVLCSVVWVMMLKYLSDNRKIIFFGLAWDLVYTSIITLEPVFLQKIELCGSMQVGVITVICGIGVLRFWPE